MSCSSGRGSTNDCKSILAIDALDTAPLARGIWCCGGTIGQDCKTAKDLLFSVITETQIPPLVFRIPALGL